MILHEKLEDGSVTESEFSRSRWEISLRNPLVKLRWATQFRSDEPAKVLRESFRRDGRQVRYTYKCSNPDCRWVWEFFLDFSEEEDTIEQQEAEKCFCPKCKEQWPGEPTADRPNQKAPAPRMPEKSFRPIKPASVRRGRGVDQDALDRLAEQMTFKWS